MQADVHAILLLALPAVAILAMLILRKRRPSARQLLIAIALATFATILAPTCNQHRCRSGQPQSQWIIIGPCLLLTLILIRSTAWRRVLGSILCVGMIGLSCHFTSLVHEPGWTGSLAQSDMVEALILRQYRAAVKMATEEHPSPDDILPAGRLRDTPLWTKVHELVGILSPERTELLPAWHSRLTGLYPTRTIPQEFWLDAGPIRTAAERISLRDQSPVLPDPRSDSLKT